MTSPEISLLGRYFNLDANHTPLPSHNPPPSVSSSGYTPESESDSKPRTRKMQTGPNGRGRGGGWGRGNGRRNQQSNARSGNTFYGHAQREYSSSSDGRRPMIRQHDATSPHGQHTDSSRFVQSVCPDSSTVYTPPSSEVSPTSSGGFSPSRRRNMAVIRPKEEHWIAHQRFKVKISGLLRGTQTRHVYDALSHYGDILRIEVKPGYVEDTAPRPRDLTWVNGLRIQNKLTTVETYQVKMGTVPSPVNPNRLYHRVNVIYGNSIDFGVQLGESQMVTMHTATARQRIEMTLDLERKKIHVKIPQTIGKTCFTYRFELPFALLKGIFRTTTGNDMSLIIPLGLPPVVARYAHGKELDLVFSGEEKIWWNHQAFFRQTEAVNAETRLKMKEGPVMDMKHAPVIDFGRWTTYRLTFYRSTLESQQFGEFANVLSDHGIAIQDTEEYALLEKTTSTLWSFLPDEIQATHPEHMMEQPRTDSEKSSLKSSTALDILDTGQVYIRFELRYQLEVCLSNGYLKEHAITREFLKHLSESPDALGLLEKVADQQSLYYNPMDIFRLRAKPRRKEIPGHCFLARAVNITPTTMHVATPIMETSNRIVRQYIADSERFIRVKFTDEKTEGQLRTWGHAYLSDAVFDRVARAMKNGIVVAGRFYAFLAFGNSQFREGGAYFYAPTETMSADDIRANLGTFSHIKTVAKYGARLGQTLSTTRPVKTNFKLETIKDVERNGFTFTDGVGKISHFMAQMAAKELEISRWFKDPPSLFQFRLGGCKGVLAVDPQLQGNVIQVRGSQYKFDAKFQGLEIIRVSNFATAYFNRQLIIVLSTLGVPDSKFIRKQDEQVHDLQLAMTDEEMAVKKLTDNIDVNHTSLTMAAMVMDGFMATKEPFMMSLLHLWRAYSIKAIKEKARIMITQGAFLLGCVDETATLRGHFNNTAQGDPNASREEKLATLPEIFLQIKHPKLPGHCRVIEGICILARNPSLHPGDIRVVRAIDVPALHHLKDVVVLPQTGDRDLANMCSGGDLDGDDYLVMWDSDFLPECINEAPMDFTSAKAPEKDGEVTIEDVADFFVTYMKNNSLGQIAHAHLAQADGNEDGIKSQECLQLAELHSTAVDYPKSGNPAILESNLKPKKWPHFMEKKHVREDKVYVSKKILGQLYDRVELVKFKPQYQYKFDDRILEAFEGDDNTTAQASELKQMYDESLNQLMAKHSVRNEFEAWTVFVLEHNQDQGDYKFAEEFGRSVENIKELYRGLSRKASDELGIPLRDFVAAMYTITARQMKKAVAESQKTEVVGGVERQKEIHWPLISFPWLFHRELGQIATNAQEPAEFPAMGLWLPVPTKSTKRPRPRPQNSGNTEILVDVGGPQGVTHYGEVLRLDFDSSATQTPTDLMLGSEPFTFESYPLEHFWTDGENAIDSGFGTDVESPVDNKNPGTGSVGAPGECV